MADTRAKTVDNTEPEAAGTDNGTDNNANNPANVKTVDNTEPEAAGTDNGADDGGETTKADDREPTKSGETKDNGKGDDDGTDDNGKETDGKGDDDGTDDANDDLDDDELEALDAKVRRRVNKVQRENVNLRGRLKDTKSELERAKRENDRLTVAINAGIDGTMLKFLNGDTVDELESNAADLLAAIGYNGRVTPSNGPVERGNNPRRGGIDPTSAAANETDLNRIGARIYGR